MFDSTLENLVTETFLMLEKILGCSTVLLLFPLLSTISFTYVSSTILHS